MARRRRPRPRGRAPLGALRGDLPRARRRARGARAAARRRRAGGAAARALVPARRAARRRRARASGCARRRRASRPSWRGSPTSPTHAGSRVARAPTSSGSPPCESARRRTAPARRCSADADGRLIEGAFTSLLWWEGETLCAVPDDAPILPGITRALLLELARDRGTPVAQRRPAPQELADRETWLVSALHGIRVVTALGERRSAGRWRTPRGRLAAAARRPDGPSRRLSARHQRRPIVNERYRSSTRTAPPLGFPAGPPARAYDPSRVRRGDSRTPSLLTGYRLIDARELP